MSPTDPFTFQTLFELINDRREHRSPNSYTSKLFNAGEDEILKKVGEEAIEVILAAKAQGNPRLIEEVSDLTYHVFVLLVERGLSLDDIRAELESRHRPA